MFKTRPPWKIQILQEQGIGETAEQRFELLTEIHNNSHLFLAFPKSFSKKRINDGTKRVLDEMMESLFTPMVIGSFYSRQPKLESFSTLH